MASMFLAVSIYVSPLARLLPLDENSTVSAPRRLAASEKLLRVRRGILKKEIRDRVAAQNIDLLAATVGRAAKRGGHVENDLEFLAGKLFQIEQMSRCHAAGIVCQRWGESSANPASLGVINGPRMRIVFGSRF